MGQLAAYLKRNFQVHGHPAGASYDKRIRSMSEVKGAIDRDCGKSRNVKDCCHGKYSGTSLAEDVLSGKCRGRVILSVHASTLPAMPH